MRFLLKLPSLYSGCLITHIFSIRHRFSIHEETLTLELSYGQANDLSNPVLKVKAVGENNLHSKVRHSMALISQEYLVYVNGTFTNIMFEKACMDTGQSMSGLLFLNSKPIFFLLRKSLSVTPVGLSAYSHRVHGIQAWPVRVLPLTPPWPQCLFEKIASD